MAKSLFLGKQIRYPCQSSKDLQQEEDLLENLTTAELLGFIEEERLKGSDLLPACEVVFMNTLQNLCNLHISAC